MQRAGHTHSWSPDRLLRRLLVSWHCLMPLNLPGAILISPRVREVGPSFKNLPVGDLVGSNFLESPPKPSLETHRMI